MKPFDQFLVNSKAELEAVDYNEYKVLVVLFTWLASNREKSYYRKEYKAQYARIFRKIQIPFHITEGLLFNHWDSKITVVYPKTGEYNVITQNIFNSTYTIDERYNYIKAASNISLVQRLNCKLYNKQIVFSEAIVTVPEETPLIIRKNNMIRFPYEEKGVTQWQIGKQQRK